MAAVGGRSVIRGSRLNAAALRLSLKAVAFTIQPLVQL